jgi:hypothetical protein
MAVDLSETTKSTKEPQNLATKAMWITSGTILLIMLMMTTCTMHSNTYDADRIREEALKQKNDVKIAEQEAIVNQANIQAQRESAAIIERLIKAGVNPIAARCGVYGWSSSSMHDDPACLIAAGAGNNPQIKETE